MVGAILSSFNSALNSACTLFSIGLYKNIFKRDASEMQVVRSGRYFGIVTAIVAVIVAPILIGQSSIFAYLQKMNGLYFIPIFAVVIVGLLTKHVPPIAAKLGLILGLIAIAFGYFVPIGDGPIAGTVINDYHFLGIVFVSLILMMLIIGKLAPTKEAWVHKHSGDVDITPWRFALPGGIALLIAVATIYVLFADFSVLNG
tara:strand:+ start:271 stop:873 length:603 start_codon:yes stop_codon:yes gene_type:complete